MTRIPEKAPEGDVDLKKIHELGGSSFFDTVKIPCRLIPTSFHALTPISLETEGREISLF